MMGASDEEFQAIVSEEDILWKELFCVGVADIAREVGEVGEAGAGFGTDGEGLFEIEVGGVGPEAEGVDDEGIDAADEVEGFVGRGFDIRDVGEAISPG